MVFRVDTLGQKGPNTGIFLKICKVLIPGLKLTASCWERLGTSSCYTLSQLRQHQFAHKRKIAVIRRRPASAKVLKPSIQRDPKPVAMVLIVRNKISTSSQGEKYLI